MGECLIINRRTGYRLPILNSIYPNNVSTTVIKGNTVSSTFSVFIYTKGYPNSYTYQWYINGSAISGATSSSYTITSSTSRTDSIYCEVTNKAGTVKSRVATLSVTQYYTPTLNSSYPADTTVVMNNSVTSKVVISTAGVPTSYTYQWYKNGTAVSGATSSSYTFTPTAIGTTTVYCKVTNAAGTVTSRTATVTATGLYLYSYGTNNTNITGGWATKGMRAYLEYQYTNAPTIVYNSDNIEIVQVATAMGNCGFAYTVNKLDLTNYSTLTIKCSYVNTNYDLRVLIADVSTLTDYYKTNSVANIYIPREDSGGVVTKTLSLSGITGSYNILLGSDGWSGTGTFKIYELKLS